MFVFSFCGFLFVIAFSYAYEERENNKFEDRVFFCEMCVEEVILKLVKIF